MTQALTVVVSDLNVRDNLHVRLVADYPPLDLEVTRVLVNDRRVTASGQILRALVSLSFACTQLSTLRTTHQLYVIVADRDFVAPIEDPKDVVGDEDEYHINVGSWVFEGCK